MDTHKDKSAISSFLTQILTNRFLANQHQPEDQKAMQGIPQLRSSKGNPSKSSQEFLNSRHQLYKISITTDLIAAFISQVQQDEADGVYKEFKDLFVSMQFHAQMQHLALSFVLVVFSERVLSVKLYAHPCVLAVSRTKTTPQRTQRDPTSCRCITRSFVFPCSVFWHRFCAGFCIAHDSCLFKT